MADVVCQRTRRQMTLGRICYVIYALGALCAAFLTAMVTDTTTGLLIGALVFWQAAIKFIILPPVVKRIRRYRGNGARFLSQLGVICTLSTFDLITVFALLSCFPQLEMLAHTAGVPFTANVIALLATTVLGVCGTVILRLEDDKYRRVQQCISSTDIPANLRSTAELIEFCQTRELDHEAEVISRNMLFLAERGYFSSAA